VPVLISENQGQLFLRGHIMRQNDHHKAFINNSQALVVFTGPHTYVSASWYENKQQASTWNYMSVHARGEIQFLEDDALLDMLDELTSHFENDTSSPSLYKELSKEYILPLTKAIVAFEIRIKSIEHVFKLSQNKDKMTYENIIEKLQGSDEQSQSIAAEMIKRKKQLFPDV
jgi:transcriptional regulator